jgi:hypothetical protein
MAAGLGFKTFTTGEVLTAADTNGYLMQGVLVFASAAARNAAITSPQEGQFAYTKDTNGLWYYDGAAWVASGATGDIEGVTAGTGISGGGTSGTVTITNSMATEITAAGDIIVGTGSGTFDNLPIGTTNQILTADTTVSPYKVKWATPATSASGLTKIASASFSGVASVEVDNVFNSTYDSYQLIIRAFGNTSGADLGLQYRYAGPTTMTGDYYGSAVRFNRSGTATSYGSTGTTSYIIADNLQTSATYYDYFNFLITNVGQGSTFAALAGYGLNNSGSETTTLAMTTASTSRLFTGFRLVPTTGTISGNYYLFGVQN